jgi:hypothetical protein
LLYYNILSHGRLQTIIWKGFQMTPIFKSGEGRQYDGSPLLFTICLLAFSCEDFDSTFVNFGLSVYSQQHEAEGAKDGKIAPYNEELGKKIALGRAEKTQSVAIIDKWLATRPFIEAMANSIIDDVVKHPGKFIPGYDRREEKYGNKKAIPLQVTIAKPEPLKPLEDPLVQEHITV